MSKRAVFMVMVAGTNITTTLLPVLISLSVSDKVGTHSDTASLEIDDTDGRIVLPQIGAPVIVATLETQRHRFLEGRHPDLLVELKLMDLDGTTRVIPCAACSRGTASQQEGGGSSTALPPPSLLLLLLLLPPVKLFQSLTHATHEAIIASWEARKPVTAMGI